MSVGSEHYALAEEDAEAVWFLGTLATIKAGAERTSGALSIVEFTHPPGYQVPPHIHHRADEAFYILAGEAQGSCGDRSWRGGPGSFIWLPRGTPHAYSVVGDATLRTLAINLPAGFEQFVAEAGEPSLERTLPPPSEPDFARLDAAAAKVGIEHLAPPPG